jgi:hypothetical protein
MRRWLRPLLEELEERILYSADFAPAVLAGSAWDAPAIEQATGRTQMALSGGTEIVVIDAGVADGDRLAVDLEQQHASGRAVEVVRIGADEDGIDRIGAALSGRSDIAAVHIVAHGDEGSIRLGTATLDAGMLLARAPQIAAWSSALSADADLLVYGCDIAAGSSGQALIDALAALTGADVAASDDPTGAGSAGGDWQLEYRSGSIEAALAPGAELQQSWHGTLNVAAGPSSSGSAIFAQNGQGQPRTASWDGRSFGPVTSSANIGQLHNVQAAEAPTRDEIIVLGVDTGGTIRGERWDGSAGTWSALPFTGTASEPERTGLAIGYEQASGHALAVWNDDSQAAGSKLRYAVWDGSSWSAAAAVGAYTGGEPQHMQIAAKPGGNEMVLVVNDASADDHALVWNGSAWGNAISLDTSGNSETDQTALAVAYESSSGRAMVAYGKNGDTELYYRQWNGAAWSAEGAAGLPASLLQEVRWITLASDPNSDRVVAGTLRTELLGSAATFAVWDGASWGAAVNTASLLTNTNDRSVAVGFEADSGAALAVYADTGNVVRYRTWSAGGGWSSQLSGPNLGANPSTLSLTADPFTDQIMLAANDATRDLNLVLWNGSVWGANTELSTDTGQPGDQPFAFVWQQTRPAATATALWLSPKADAASPGWPGANAVYKSEILQLGEPKLQFSPGATDGTFRHVFDLGEFAVDGDVNIDAVHYVSRTVNLPGLTLQAGDVLFSVDANETLSGNNTLAVARGEVILFRPDIPGDYRSGTFAILLDDFAALHGGGNTIGLALVEQDTVFGEVTLSAGTFLFARDGAATHNDVYCFVPTGVGAGSTAGAIALVLRGNDYGLGSRINGLHLVSNGTAIGDVVLPAGSLLVSLDADDNSVGSSNLNARKEDVFFLSVAQTSLSGTAQVTASAFLDGAALGLAGERIDALTLYTSNHAPVLDTSGAPVLGAIAEDALNPSGTTVAALLASGAGGVPVSDLDALDPRGIAVTGLDAVNGSWQFSTTGGASWSAFGSVSNSDAVLLDASALIRFVPNANFNGTVSLTFRAWDGYSGSNGLSGVDTGDNGGASAFSAEVETALLTVTAVNDNPVLALNAGMTVNQGATVVIGAARLFSSDIDHASAAITYTVMTAPQFGTLQLGGVDLSVLGNTFTQADIDANLLTYVHAGTFDPADSFVFSVADSALGSAGGPATFAISITTANDPPVITLNELTIAESGSAVPVLTASDLNNSASQLAYTATAVSGGRFELAGNPGVAITTFTQAQVDAAQVRFVHDGGEAAPSYQLSLSDGAASTGPLAADVSFTNTNDAPVMTGFGLAVLEGGTAVPVLVAADPDDAPAALNYTVSGVTHGHFELTDTPGAAVTTFTQLQIDAAEVLFVHDGGEDAPAFQVSVSDGAGSDGPRAAAISFTRVNDAPAIAVNALALSEGQAVVISPADIAAADPDTPSAQLLWSVTAIANGRFEDAAAPGVAIVSFTQAQIDAGELRFVHDGGEVASAYTLELSDGSVTAAAQAAAITFTAIDDAPVISKNELSVAEGAAVAITNAHIAATDPDTAAAQLVWTVSGLSGGRFEYVSAPGIAITSFTQGDVDGGSVRFVHDGNETAPAYALTLTDAMSSSGPDAATVTFSNRDDAPALAVNTGATITAGESVTITAAMLRGTDADTPAVQLVFELTALPVHGTLLLNGRALGAGETFTQADIDAGRLAYRHDGGTTAGDAFDFRTADASTTLAGASFAVTVDAAPPAPTVPTPIPVSPAPVSPEPVPTTAAPTGPAQPASVQIPPDPTLSAAPIEAPPQSAAEPAAASREKPAAPPAGLVDAAAHPIATMAANQAAADDAGVRTLAGLAESAQRFDRLEAAPATNWSARVSAAPAPTPLLLPSFFSEAHAQGTDRSMTVQLASGQPPRAALLELEEVRNRIEEQFAQNRTVVASTIAVSTGLSVGYVLWLVRGGLLLTSVLSALPAWQVVDPLPVLGTMKRARDDTAADDDAIEGLFQRARARAQPRPDNVDLAPTARARLPEEVGA